MRAIKSERRDMLDREYTRHCISEAAAWGESVGFYLRHISPLEGTRAAQLSHREAVRRARLAGRWALKVLGREK
jgi:hypothetical protein